MNFSIQKNTLGSQDDPEQDLEDNSKELSSPGINNPSKDSKTTHSEISKMLLIVQKNSLNSYQKECENLEKQGKIDHLVANAHYRSTLTGKDSTTDNEEKLIR